MLPTGHWAKFGYLRGQWDPSGVTRVTGLMQLGLETASKEKKTQDKVSMLRAVGYVENASLGPITSLVTTSCFTRDVPFTVLVVSAFGGEV